jgi:hypothetical protein
MRASGTEDTDSRRIVGFKGPSTATSAGSEFAGETEESFKRSDDAQRSDEQLVLPSASELKALYDLSLMGDLWAIQERASQIENQDARLTPFTSKICQLAEDFEVDKIQEFLKQYLST